MERVVVDDLRVFEFEATYLRTLDEAMAWLATERRTRRPVDELFLDHDLSVQVMLNDRLDTVRPFVKGLVREARRSGPLPIGKIYLVTSDRDGARWMEVVLSPWHDVEDISEKVRFSILS